MSVTLTTDGAAPGVAIYEPDAHGQAAIMLAESMLHALVDTSVLTHAEALDILLTAIEAKREVATEAGESVGRMEQSLSLLSRIHASFATDAAPPRGGVGTDIPRLA